MRSVSALLINILIVVIIGGLNILMRYLTHKQRSAARPRPIKEAPASVQVPEQEPAELFGDPVPAEAPATLFQEEDWTPLESVRTVGVKKRRFKIGPKRLRQAVIMSEVIREPRVQRPWPMR